MATVNRLDNTSLLNTGAAWGGGGAGTGGQPAAADIASWGATVNIATNTGTALGGSVSWGGIKLQSGQTSNITIPTSTAVLTVGASGIDLSTSGANLTITSNAASATGGISIGTSQTWTVPSGKTLAFPNVAFVASSSPTWTLNIDGTATVGNYFWTLNTGANVALIKNGAGLLQLQGSTVSYNFGTTGSITINAGTLQWDTGATKPNWNAASLTIASGAAFSVNWTGGTIGYLAGAGTLKRGPTTGNFNPTFGNSVPTNATFSGNIDTTAGAIGTFTKSGTNIQTLSGDSTATWANAATVAVTGGGLVLSNAGALGTSTGANNISSGAYLALNGVTYSSSGTRTTSVASGGQFRVVAGGVWNSSGAVTIAGTGISSTGAIYGDGNANNAIGAPITVGTTPTIYADTGGTLTINSTVSLAANTLTFAGPGTHVMTGTLAGTGPIIKNDAGILDLNTASTKTAGAWTLNGGETWIANANALGAAASSIATNISAGAKLLIDGAITTPSNKTITAFAGTLGATGVGGGTWSGPISLTASSATIENNTPGTLTVSGDIDQVTAGPLSLSYAGTGNIVQSGVLSSSSGYRLDVTKNGSGTTTFAAQSTANGVYTFAAGTANAGVDEAGAALGLNGPFGNSTSAGSMLFTGGTLQYSALNARDYSSRFSTTGSQQWKIDTNNQTVSFGTALAGTGSSLTKLGSGTLTTVSSSYTGATSILGGTLLAISLADAGSNSSLGASSSAATNLVIDGGTLRYTGISASTNRLFTVGADGATLDLQNVTFSLNSGTIPIQGSTTLTLTGTNTNNMYPILADSGSFVLSLSKNGAGTWSLFGSNTFTGPISVNAGTLNANVATALGSTSGVRTLTVASGATLQVSATLNYSSLNVQVSGTGVGGTSGAILLTGSATIPVTLQSASLIRFASVITGLLGTINTNGYDLTIAGAQAGQVYSVISGSGNLIVGATGNTANIQLNGQNTFTGTTTTSGATLLISGSLGLGSYSANIINNGGITFQSATIHTISGVVSGTGTLTVGSGDVTLTNTNTYTGRTVNGGGTLRIASIADLGVNSNIGAPTGVSGTIGVGAPSQTIYTGAAASTNRPIDLQSATGSATITNNGSGTLSFTASAWTATGAGSKTVTFNGSSPISVASTIVNNSSTNTTALTYSGSSTLTLSGVSTYTGLTTVSSGTLDISSGDNRLASGGSITVSGTGTLALGSANQTTTTLTTSGTGNNLTGNGTLTATTYNASSSSGTTTAGPNLGVSGTTTKSNAGTLVLNGANSFGVYTHNAGTTTFAAGNTFSGAFTMSAGTVTFSAANTFGSTFTASGTVNYNAANNFGGLGTISAGLSSALTLNGTGSNVTLPQNIDIANTTNFLLPTANSQLTLSGVLSGSAANVFLGSTGVTTGANSVLRLTNNANSWSGSSLNIQNGALYISDARQLGTGSKTVAVRATGTGAVGFVLDGSSADIILPSTVSFTTSSGTGVTPQPTYFGIVNVAGNNVIQGTVSMTGGGGDSYFTVTGGTLTISGNVSAAATARVMQLGGTGSGTVSGIIGVTNAPAVRVSGSSTWTLSNANTYTGGTTTAGTATLVAGNVTALGVGNVTLGAGTAIKTLTGSGPTPQKGKLTITGTFDNSAGATIYIGG